MSIVLPTYKRPELLQRAVASVLAQTLTDWELIITDDEDPPGETWKYLTQLAAKDSRIRISGNSGPHGLSGNMNNGLRLARADWIKILQDDDVLHRRCLECFLDVVNGDRSIALASCLCDYYVHGRLTRSQVRGRRDRIERLPRRSVHLAMYLQDVDIGTPTQAFVNRACIEKGALFEDREGLINGVDSWWFARLLQHGDLLMVNEVLVALHQGEHASMTSSIGEAALDTEFQVLRELILPLIDPRLDPPGLRVANQSLRLIRALHRLASRKPRDAFRLAATAWHPQAWYLAARWLLRRGFPGRFEIVPREKVER